MIIKIKLQYYILPELVPDKNQVAIVTRQQPRSPQKPMLSIVPVTPKGVRKKAPHVSNTQRFF